MENNPKKLEYSTSNNEILRNLELVRKKYDLNWLLEESKKYSSILKFSKEIGISESALKRAINEVTILKKFPGLDKCKSQLISHFRIKKELELFTRIYNIYQNPFRKLRKIIKDWDNSLEKNPFILLNQLQHDVLIGTLLGDGNVRKRWGLSYFRCSHSEKQKGYLLWKYNLFKEFTKSDIHTSKRKNRLNMFDFQTLSNRIFNYYYSLFYKNGKKIITAEILNKLNPMSIAIWICDDGSYCNKQGNIILCTNCFSLEEHKLIKNYFKEKWNLDPTVGFRDKKYYYLRFKKQDSIKLINIIKNFIPVKEMFYKIGEKND